MIPFDFEYERPDTTEEAVRLFQHAEEQGLQPMYYGGGTEILTMARIGQLYTGAVIDLKHIPELRVLEVREGTIIKGAALSLIETSLSNVYPLLSRVSGQIADHNSRNKITLGGNLIGRIRYKEAVLPLLIADSNLLLVGPDGRRTVPIRELFLQKLRLRKGELLAQIHTDHEFATAPVAFVRKHQLERIDYPLVTICALKKDGRIRLGVSGLLEFPFRSEEMEEALNETGLPMQERISEVVRRLPGPVLADIRASAEYRTHVFRLGLEEVLESLDGGGG